MSGTRKVIIAPSYCLTPARTLTRWSLDSTRLVGGLLRDDSNTYAVLSGAHETSPLELKLKLALLDGIPSHRLRFLEESTDTFDEFRKLQSVLTDLKPTELVIVVERWHAWRIPGLCRRVFPGMPYSLVTFRTQKVERTLQPGLKSTLLAFPGIWVPWQMCFWMLNPIILRMYAPGAKGRLNP